MKWLGNYGNIHNFLELSTSGRAWAQRVSKQPKWRKWLTSETCFFSISKEVSKVTLEMEMEVVWLQKLSSPSEISHEITSYSWVWPDENLDGFNPNLEGTLPPLSKLEMAFQIQIVPVRDIPEKTVWYICPIILIVAYHPDGLMLCLARQNANSCVLGIYIWFCALLSKIQR